jgi:hypothetical protein
VLPTNFPKRKWRLLVSKNEKLLAKEQENSESLLNNLSDSGKKTKRETTVSPNELIDIELFDQWVDNLDSATQESFLAFCKETSSIIEIYLYARFLDYRGTITSCDKWVSSNYKKPDHRKVLLNEIEEIQEDMRKLREDIENLVVKRDAGVARLAAMTKELRGTIHQVESFTSSRDRKGLLMAGADQAIRELLMIFKDDPIEAPLQEASMSVWAKMQLSE